MIQKLKSFIKYLLSQKLCSFFLKNQVFIFVYHDISNEANPAIKALHNTSINNFRNQIDFISSNFKIISLDQLVSMESFDDGPYAVITFDDGLQSIIENGMPILSEKKIPFALFLNENAIKNQYLWNIELIENIDDLKYLNDFYQNYISKNTSWEQFLSNPMRYAVSESKILSLCGSKNTGSSKYRFIDRESIEKLKQNKLISFGDHSKNHLNLKLAEESDLDFSKFLDSKEYFNAELQLTSKHFAIPFGKKDHYNDTILEELYKRGYKYIYITNPVGYKKGSSDNNYKLIPRIGMTNQSIQDIIFILNRTIIKKIDL